MAIKADALLEIRDCNAALLERVRIVHTTPTTQHECEFDFAAGEQFTFSVFCEWFLRPALMAAGFKFKDE